MENAAKALMIAAGILIAIVITSVLVSTFSTMNEFQLSKLSEEERQQIIEFNEQYIKYVNQYVYGTEVGSLINKHISDNLVEVIVLPAGTVPPTDVGQDVQYYKCTGVTYNENTGRVNSITFRKIDV